MANGVTIAIKGDITNFESEIKKAGELVSSVNNSIAKSEKELAEIKSNLALKEKLHTQTITDLIEEQKKLGITEKDIKKAIQESNLAHQNNIATLKQEKIEQEKLLSAMRETVKYSQTNISNKQKVIAIDEKYNQQQAQATQGIVNNSKATDSVTNSLVRHIRQIETAVLVLYTLKTAYDATLGTGLKTAAAFEQMQIGIASLIAASSQDVTSLGKHVTASEKFTLAQKDAADAVLQLRKANIDTPATLKQLTVGFQSALGPALQLGFSIKQTVEYSRLMTIAASALTVPMEQISQEMRSILNGTIDQNSIVANSLRITNEQMKAHEKLGDSYEFVISKLKDFNAAGKVINQSWDGITSNLRDNWEAFTADVVTNSGMFKDLKAVFIDLSDGIHKNSKDIVEDFDSLYKNIKQIEIPFSMIKTTGKEVSEILDMISISTKETMKIFGINENITTFTASILGLSVVLQTIEAGLKNFGTVASSFTISSSGIGFDLDKANKEIITIGDLGKSYEEAYNKITKAKEQTSASKQDSKEIKDIKEKIEQIKEQGKLISNIRTDEKFLIDANKEIEKSLGKQSEYEKQIVKAKSEIEQYEKKIAIAKTSGTRDTDSEKAVTTLNTLIKSDMKEIAEINQKENEKNKKALDDAAKKRQTELKDQKTLRDLIADTAQEKNKWERGELGQLEILNKQVVSKYESYEIDQKSAISATEKQKSELEFYASITAVTEYNRKEEEKAAKEKEDALKKEAAWQVQIYKENKKYTEEYIKLQADMYGSASVDEIGQWYNAQIESLFILADATNMTSEEFDKLLKKIDDIRTLKDRQQTFNFKMEKSFFDSFESSLASSIEGAFKGKLDLSTFFTSIGDNMLKTVSQSMAKSVTNDLSSSMKGLFGTGIGGSIASVGVGLALSSVASMFDSPKRKSNEEKAQEAFDKFIDGLKNSTVALDIIGNAGSSTGEQITSIQSEMDRLIAKLNKRFPEMTNGVFTRETNFSKVWAVNADVKELAKLQTELNTIALNGLVKSLDYSKLSSKEIDGIVTSLSVKNTDFSIKKYEDLKKELEDFAIAAKANGGVMTNATRVQEILADKTYQAGENYKDVVAIKLKADEELIANLATWTQRNETATETTNRLITASGIKSGLDIKSLDAMNASIKLMELEAIATNGMDAAELSALQSAEALRDGLFGLADAAEETLYGITKSEQGFLKFKDSLTGGQNYLDIAVMNVMGIDKLISDIPNTVDGITTLYKEFEKTGTGIDEFEQAILDAGVAAYKSAEDIKKAANAALEASNNNIKTFAESLLDSKSAGTLLAGDIAGLSAMFTKLSTDTDGLTDADLSLLSANKELVSSTTDLDKILSDTASNISTLESAFDKIKSTIDTLRGSSKTAEDNIKDFYISMAETKALSTGTDYTAYAKSLDETIAASSALINAENFKYNRDMQFAQLVAANQFEELGVINKSQTDYLKEIADNTRNQITTIVDSINALGANILAAMESTKEQVVVKPSYVAPAYVAPANEASQIAAQVEVNKSLNAVGRDPTPTTATNKSIAQLIALFPEAKTVGAILDSAKSAGLTYAGFAVGTPNVPYDMMAQIHKNEMIVPATFNQGVQNGSITIGDNSAIVSGMQEQNKSLKEQNRLLNSIVSELKEQVRMQKATFTETEKVYLAVSA